MGISEIFSDTFDVLRKNPKIIWPLFLFTLFITIFALVAVGRLLPAGGYGSLGAPIAASGMQALLSLLPSLLTFTAIIVVVAIFIGILVEAMYVSIADQAYKKGKISLGKAFDVATKSYWRLLGGYLIYLAIWIGICIIFFALFLATTFAPSARITTVFSILLLLVLFVVGVFMSIFFYQLQTVIILERLKPVQGVKRAIAIGRAKTRDVFAMLAITIVLALVIGAVIAVIVSVVEISLAYVSVFSGIGIGQLINVFLSSFMSSWLVLTPVYFYHEYVVRDKRKK